MVEVILSALLLLQIFCVWALIQNQKTYNDRREISPKATDPLFWEKMAAYDAVGYDTHLWARIKRSDWRDLYDPILFEAVQ